MLPNEFFQSTCQRQYPISSVTRREFDCSDREATDQVETTLRAHEWMLPPVSMEAQMHNVFYLIGVIVVVLALVGFVA